MDKSILVIDTPNKCYDCQLMTDNMYCKGFTPYYAEDGTHVTKRCVEDYVMHGDKPLNCPLKPMPERFEPTILTNYCLGSADGWNACIDEILGEE